MTLPKLAQTPIAGPAIEHVALITAATAVAASGSAAVVADKKSEANAASAQLRACIQKVRIASDC